MNSQPFASQNTIPLKPPNIIHHNPPLDDLENSTSFKDKLMESNPMDFAPTIEQEEILYTTNSTEDKEIVHDPEGQIHQPTATNGDNEAEWIVVSFNKKKNQGRRFPPQPTINQVKSSHGPGR
uniref:Uncharacterized protein LOC104239898 isoform X2 n=1 Tax=Nicotiana sylvestris TaxID=4096 RepID=A0A1U7XLL0_NICSY|nr:PREDICTED: uncharacterized protein LOC104239898 isoform X2 [Nicotiana sylvestris]